MSSYKPHLLLFVLIVILMPFDIATAGEIKPWSTSVKVNVAANDNIKGQIESYIKRELRSLSDVTVVDEEAEWELQIVAMEPATKGGYKTGIILSVVIISRFPNGIMSAVVQEQYKESIKNMTGDLYYYPDHWLRVGDNDALRTMCFELSAEFDSTHLEPSRMSYQELINSIEKKND